MTVKQDFEKLIEKLKTERDEISLKLHLASMEAKEEFDAAESQWSQIRQKAADIADDTVETSDEYIAKAKIIGEELKEAYSRIAKRLS
ncbi:hypothetical protein [Methylosarcina fibrata]|uniref:hypothetical protein n=1 Tax=Methylosarcina fibrata TaxID=105972 RepID=UPI000372780A|nr:hypothetical protein [Methylosarcina fibrata]